MTGSVTDEQSSATTWTDMRGDRAFAMAVLGKNGRALEYAPVDVRSDREIVLTAATIMR